MPSSEQLIARHLSDESGYVFVVVRESDSKIVGGYWNVSVAVGSIEGGWQAELSWHLVDGNDLALDAKCLATGKRVARLHKIPMSRIPLALVL